MEKAKRYNKGKLRYGLIPTFAKQCIAEVYSKGAHKYSVYKDKDGNEILGQDIPFANVGQYTLIEDASDNWRKGLPWMDAIDSIERHIEAFKSGEDLDPELGTHHLGNAAWGLITILEFYKIKPQFDNRPHAYLQRPKIGLDIDEVLADWVGAMMDKFQISDRSVFWNDFGLIENFNTIKDDPEFWLGIKPKLKLEDIPFEPHCYITARSIDTEITTEWLRRNGFPKAPVYSVGFDKTKVEVAKEAGIDIFVDDSYKNFVELNAGGICTYLFDAPHNQRYQVGYKRIKSLKEL